MTTRDHLLATALICLCVAAASSQAPSYAVKKCDAPKEEAGVLPRISGQAFYRLAKDGKPDTASIQVLRVFGISAAGFRSVVARRLSTCRFDVEKAALNAPAGVMSEIMADTTWFAVAIATPWITPAAPLAIEPLGLPKDSFPMRGDDRRIEERPRQISCKEATALPPQSHRTTSMATTTAAIAQAQATQRTETDQWNVAHAGTLVAEVRVGIDGKPGSAVRVISVTNAFATTSLAELIGGCRYVPGRYHGVLVPSFIQTTITVQPAKVP
jgi:hypothetical protein